MTTPPGGPAPARKQPSLVPGVVLLALAAVLIAVVLIKPDMPGWLKTTIAILAVLVVVALLFSAFRVFRDTTRRGNGR